MGPSRLARGLGGPVIVIEEVEDDASARNLSGSLSKASLASRRLGAGGFSSGCWEYPIIFAYLVSG